MKLEHKNIYTHIFLLAYSSISFLSAWKGCGSQHIILIFALQWLDMREYKDFQKTLEEEEALHGELYNNQVMASKMKEIAHWERNGMFEEVKNTSQKVIGKKRGHLRVGQRGKR